MKINADLVRKQKGDRIAHKKDAVRRLNETSTVILKYVHKTWLLNLLADCEFPNK